MLYENNKRTVYDPTSPTTYTTSFTPLLFPFYITLSTTHSSSAFFSNHVHNFFYQLHYLFPLTQPLPLLPFTPYFILHLHLLFCLHLSLFLFLIPHSPGFNNIRN